MFNYKLRIGMVVTAILVSCVFLSSCGTNSSEIIDEKVSKINTEIEKSGTINQVIF